MKTFKIFTIAALLLAPTTLMARTNFCISLNLFDCIAPFFAPMPTPVVVAPPPPPPPTYYVPCQPRTIVKEYHYYHAVPQMEEPVEEINPQNPHYYYPQKQFMKR